MPARLPNPIWFALILVGPSRPGWAQLISFAAPISKAVICCWRCEPANLFAWRGRWLSKRRKPLRAEARRETRAAQIARRAEELSQKVGHPHAIGLSIWASGVAAYLVGNWKRAAELCERAAEVLRDQCTGVTWELTIAHRFMLSALLIPGRDR